MTAPILQITDLSVALPPGADRPWAVEHIHLQIHAGEVLCLVGESGSGKTVCAQAALRMIPPALRVRTGQVLLEGADLFALPQEQVRALRGRRAAMVFQEPLSALNPLMPVGRQIAEVLQVHGQTDRAAVEARVLEVLHLVGLPDPAALRNRLPFQLSGGQRQRVVIAMALALEPALLVADEPTTALDVTTQAQILSLLRSLGQRMGMAVLFVTHDFGVVAEIADRVAVMQNGRIVEEGSTSAVLQAPRHPYTQQLVAAARRTRPPMPAPGPSAVQDMLQVQSLSVRLGARPNPAWRRWLGKPERGVQALDQVTLSLQAGQTLGIVGESGSGKSTLGRCLLNLVQPDAGQVTIGGLNVTGTPEARLRPLRRRWQMVFQDPQASLNPRHTVGHSIMRPLLAAGESPAAAQEQAHQWLQAVGLEPGAFARYPSQFSGGQRQRIVIARALALKPELLIADEPVSALDMTVQAQILDLLRELQQRLSLTMVFITHDLHVAASVCHRIGVMHRGRLVEEGLAAQVLTNPQHAYTRQLLASIPGRQELQAAG